MILIGQLAKHIDEPASAYGKTSMEELLDAAFEVIENVSERVPCRCVVLECRKSLETDTDAEKKSRDKLHEKYLEYRFTAFQEVDNLVQYVMTI